MNEHIQKLIVDGTLYGLVFFSVITWILIIAKGVQHFRLGRQNRVFTKQFWGASNLDAAANLSDTTGAKARLAASGFSALYVVDGESPDLEHSWDRQELLERHLRQQIQKEYESLESGLAVLASIGSTSPFVGLFGTVFGIIHALTALSKAASPSIDIVAGPLGEALIATGVGIAVAVPAVLAYNFYLRRLKLASADLDSYATDFVNLAQKSGFRVSKPVAKVSATQSQGGSAVHVNNQVIGVAA
ncbi:MotA/TolQ/ExbB proton channel family protein [Undibacterium amnicola]|uniref:MotA/TolQ/ExbB proton channel family protein n=1 Tax=Undibacterium amnicola TaxID=1834038 RepID=A0ABR6XUU4_9BURK|nr:MotA/TolQ/ExbB proton channel family protein [Undibacterium amnicola]MBC3832702.1 MotA/TolQ/ExbB proton channel family protein [Undibacterium amnicola]